MANKANKAKAWAGTVPLNSGDAKRSIALHGSSPRTPARPVVKWRDYGTPEWLAARRSLIGASEVAAVLGLSPFASPFSLWWAKQKEWDLDPSLRLRLGHDLEPVIGNLFAEERPDLLVCRPAWSLWRHRAYPFVGCSPDFLAVAGSGVTEPGAPWVEPVECKSDEGGPGWGKPGTDEVPEHHRMQLLWQCAVFGAPRGHIVRVAGKRYSDYVIEYDADAAGWFAGAVEEAAAFMTSLEIGLPPEVDDHKATTDALGRLNPDVIDGKHDPDAYADVDDGVAAAYEAQRVVLDTAEREFRRLQNLIRGQLGRAKWGRYRSTGRRFVERRVYKRREYTVPDGMVDALYPKAS